MNYKIPKLLSSLNDQLSFIDLEIDNQSTKCENAIEIILKTIKSLRTIISKTKFKTEADEIKFFKEIKPQFTSKLIYYNTIFKIERRFNKRIIIFYYH